ncbi:MAG: Fe2+-dependent dioxygenase [Pseudohongiellaceae bacterium]
MILPVSQVLPEALLASLRETASRDTLFRDGAATAGWYARTRKHNLQAGDDPELQELLDRVRQRLLHHELVQAAARPKRVVRLLLSRYEPGMQYGAHIDDALMDGHRTDLSFTIFLSPPNSYEGGALVIDETDGEKTFRLEAGDMLLYPSTTLHRVDTVTSGRRLAIVGWLQSHVRDRDQREILFDVDRAIHQLRHNGHGDDAPALELLLKTRSNLLRRWAG